MFAREDFLTAPSPSRSSLSMLLFPERVFFFPRLHLAARAAVAREQLPDLLCDSASSRPPGSLPETSTASPRRIYIPYPRDRQLSAAREGWVMKGRTPGPQQVGCSLPSWGGTGWPAGVYNEGLRSHAGRWVQKCRFSPTTAWHGFRSSNVNNAWSLVRAFSSWLLGN